MKFTSGGVIYFFLMTTKNQLQRKIRRKNISFVASPGLMGHPQQRGRYVRSVIITPRKPNSAQRKSGKIRLSNRKAVFVKIPGRGSIPHKFAVVLVRGKGHRDTPGARYSLVRGNRECMPLFNKKRRRSIYGAKRKQY